MLSKLTQQEKEEIVLNSLVLKYAIDEIILASQEEVEPVLERLTAAAEADLQALSAAQIDNIIATSDRMRVDENPPSVTSVVHIFPGENSSDTNK